MFAPDEKKPVERKKLTMWEEKNHSRRQVLEYERIQYTCGVGTSRMWLWAPGICSCVPSPQLDH